MNLGEESVIVWRVPWVIMVGSMIMCGWTLIFLGRLVRIGKYGRDNAAGIRMAGTLASEEAWKVDHIRASRAIQVVGVVFYISAAWAVIPYFSYYTAPIGLCLIATGIFVVIGYAIFVADRAAVELLRKKAEAEEEQDL